MDLDKAQLAATSGFKSCFLHTDFGMSEFSAVGFAKELEAEHIYTVGDFLKVDRDLKCSPRLVAQLDMHLAQYTHLPENKHAAPGTCAGCAVALA